MKTEDGRAKLFAQKRRVRTRQQAERSAADRVVSADELFTLWRPDVAAAPPRPTDESIELWRELRTRLRARP